MNKIIEIISFRTKLFFGRNLAIRYIRVTVNQLQFSLSDSAKIIKVGEPGFLGDELAQWAVNGGGLSGQSRRPRLHGYLPVPGDIFPLTRDAAVFDSIGAIIKSNSRTHMEWNTIKNVACAKTMSPRT